MGINQNITAILFDLDGTVFNLDVDWDSLKQKTAQYFGKEVPYSMVLELSKQPKHTELAIILEEAELQGAKQGSETEHAAKALADLQKGYKLAIITRNARSSAKHVMEHFGLRDVLLLGREDVAKLKPHPEGLQAALDQFGISPDQAVMVGDTRHDVESAHAIGMPCIVVKNGNLKYMPTGADYYIDSLAEISDCLERIRKQER